MQQDRVGVHHGEVERERGLVQAHLGHRAVRALGVLPGEERLDAPQRGDDALGVAGAAGGEQDVERVVRRESPVGVVGQDGAVGRPAVVGRQGVDVVNGQRERGGGDLDDPGGALLGNGGVDRHVRVAGLEAAQHAHQHLRLLVAAEGDGAAVIGQPIVQRHGQPVGSGDQVGPGHPAVAADVDGGGRDRPRPTRRSGRESESSPWCGCSPGTSVSHASGTVTRFARR